MRVQKARHEQRGVSRQARDNGMHWERKEWRREKRMFTIEERIEEGIVGVVCRCCCDDNNRLEVHSRQGCLPKHVEHFPPIISAKPRLSEGRVSALACGRDVSGLLTFVANQSTVLRIALHREAERSQGHRPMSTVRMPIM